MASLFAEAWSDASVDIDAEFGEAFELLPTAQPASGAGVPDPNARPIASLARDPVPFVGIFFDKGAAMHAHGRSMADSTTRTIAAEKPMIDADLTQFAQPPREGDRVQRAEPALLYTIANVVVDDLNRGWIHLAELRAPASAVR